MTIPVGWKVLKLVEVADGGLFSDGDWVESKDQDPDGDIRLIQLADIGAAQFRNRSNRWLRYDQAAALGCTFLKAGDVLIARMPEPIGRACLVPVSLGNAVTAVDVAILRIQRTDIDARFAMWAINSPQFHAAVVAQQSGTTRKRISRKNLAALSIPVPPIEEQLRIVEKLEEHLTHLDAGICSLQRTMKRLATLRLALLVDARRRLIADGTELESIGAICDTALGKMLDSKKSQGEPTPYLRNINVRWGRVDLIDVSTVPLTSSERQRLALQQGDLLVCEGGEPGRCAVWEENLPQIAYQKALHRVRIRDHRLNPYFVAAMLEETIRTGRADRLFTGTTIRHLPQEKLRAIKIPIPIPEIQQALLQKLSNYNAIACRFDREIERENSRVTSLRNSLLGTAFTGGLSKKSIGIANSEEIAGV